MPYHSNVTDIRDIINNAAAETISAGAQMGKMWTALLMYIIVELVEMNSGPEVTAQGDHDRQPQPPTPDEAEGDEDDDEPTFGSRFGGS